MKIESGFAERKDMAKIFKKTMKNYIAQKMHIRQNPINIIKGAYLSFATSLLLVGKTISSKELVNKRQ